MLKQQSQRTAHLCEIIFGMTEFTENRNIPGERDKTQQCVQQGRFPAADITAQKKPFSGVQFKAQILNYRRIVAADNQIADLNQGIWGRH